MFLLCVVVHCFSLYCFGGDSLCYALLRSALLCSAVLSLAFLASSLFCDIPAMRCFALLRLASRVALQCCLFCDAMLRFALLCVVLSGFAVCVFARFAIRIVLCSPHSLCCFWPALCFCACLYIALFHTPSPRIDLPCFAFGRFASRADPCAGSAGT